MSEPIKLQQNADELLRDFPISEPDYEAQAAAIAARLGSAPAAGALSDDDLFKAPSLDAEVGEPALPSSVRAATAPKSNFAEMARKSVQKKDDDRAALAKELLAATAQARRPDAEMVERVRAAGKANATSTPFPASEPRSERSSGVVTREAPVAPAAPPPAPLIVAPKPANDNRGTIIGFLGVVVGIAACVALYLKTNESPPASDNAIAAAQRADGASKPTEPHAAVLPGVPPRANEGVVSPDTLPAAPTAASPPKAAASSPKAATAAAAPPKAAAAGSPSGVPKVELEEDPAPPQAPAAVAEKKPEPSPEPPMKPAEGSTGSVPLNPSAGAVSTALGAVRGGAQACLAGQTESVTAVVTFAADGHVLRVSAGGPSGACIQAALSKAHIAPFAKESFSATTTIRPP